jgi:hypothetical protein
MREPARGEDFRNNAVNGKRICDAPQRPGRKLREMAGNSSGRGRLVGVGWIKPGPTREPISRIDELMPWRARRHERSPGVIRLETTRVNRTAEALQRAVAAGAYAGSIGAFRIALGCALGWIDPRHPVWH